ncbi:hypothetical protein M8C21_020074 [Ambrosia artemisiifolia]|uniref:Uncharacterized protein n=1 Tax=Ambrosia artemisiifolia TaxID=4212 RepID=A0AAD5CTS3_AMBAR|nr:hypothetical protein M8C21_020074 [Ambrosia artemisiifolia]
MCNQFLIGSISHHMDLFITLIEDLLHLLYCLHNLSKLIGHMPVDRGRTHQVDLRAEDEVPIVPYGEATSIEGHTLSPNGGVCIDMTLMNV